MIRPCSRRYAHEIVGCRLLRTFASDNQNAPDRRECWWRKITEKNDDSGERKHDGGLHSCACGPSAHLAHADEILGEIVIAGKRGARQEDLVSSNEYLTTTSANNNVSAADPTTGPAALRNSPVRYPSHFGRATARTLVRPMCAVCPDCPICPWPKLLGGSMARGTRIRT